MLFRTHIVFAVFIYLLLSPFLPEKIIFGLFFLIATLFVDIDSRKSKIGKKWFFRPLQWCTKHRGMFHSLFFALMLSVSIFFLNKDAGIGFLFGYILHLWLDCFTLSGVKLFWPAFDFKFKGRVRSGGIVEEVLFVLVLLFDIFLIARLFFKPLF